MAEYPEILPSCADKYSYLHETACCYRADIVSCEEDGTFTVEWTETNPPVEGGAEADQVSGVKTSYGCGWCLAPFLTGHEINPFCPGSHVLVLDNQAETDRYLIIGFDAKYYLTTSDLLKPCIPDNLGFYFSNARYGAPYFTEDTVDGQTTCSPVNEWAEGEIVLPRGTENDLGEIITIATDTGEITAIKPFQVPGFDAIAEVSRLVTIANKNHYIYISSNGHLVVIDAKVGVYPKAKVVIVTNIYCFSNIGSPETVEYTIEADPINYPLFFLGNQNLLVTGHDFVTYPGVVYPIQMFPVVTNSEGIITSICLANSPHMKITITPGVDEVGSNIYTSSAVLENVGSFTMSCGEAIQPDTNWRNGIFFEPSAQNGDRSYNITGSCLLFDNGSGFEGHQTVSMAGSTSQEYSSSSGTISASLVSSDSYSIAYNLGGFSWVNSLNSSLNMSVINVGGNRTDNSTSEITEIRYYILAVDTRLNNIVYLKQSITLSWVTSGTITSSYVGIGWPLGSPDTTGYGGGPVQLEQSGSCTKELILWTPNGQVVLHSETFDCSGEAGISYLFYKGYLPDESNSFFDQGVFGIFKSFPSDLYYLVPCYDEALNVWGAFNYNGGYGVPGATIKSSLDGRQILVESSHYGIKKYFVDNVEWFTREHPDSWGSKDILNR